MARFLWWISLPVSIVLYVLIFIYMISGVVQGAGIFGGYALFAIYAAIDLAWVAHLAHEDGDDGYGTTDDFSWKGFFLKLIFGFLLAPLSFAYCIYLRVKCSLEIIRGERR